MNTNTAAGHRRSALLAFAGLLVGSFLPGRGTALAAPPQDPGPQPRPESLAAALGEDDLSFLAWRNIGPGGVGGRVVDVAVPPRDASTMYVATAQGGVWKTTDGGNRWRPVFENEGSSSIGSVAVAPSNAEVVWVGTGEANGRNLVSTSWGDGVYRSTDGGDSWTHMGLPLSQHIGRIRIHPRDERTVYVPVIGSLWHDRPELNAARGLWRTTDGGTTWEKILSAGDHAGFVDLDLDPRDPNVMYAASWQRERVDWSWLPTGDDGGLFRTTDGGGSWVRLSGGLPTSSIGKVGVSVCASAPDVVYAIFEGPRGGVFRSTDRGESWERRNDRVRGSHWYSQIRCDPNDPELVYTPDTSFMVSHDGGRTFDNEMGGKPVHVDHHALWIDPADSNHLALGNDGGLYLSRDRGTTWRYVSLPVTQYFEIGVDMSEPFYFVCGGTQDNSSYCGPSATRASDGIVDDDWFATSGGDGFYAQIDPGDPRIVYSESQNGGLLRVNTETGERKRIQPVDPRELRPAGSSASGGEVDRFRWNWSAPILISHRDPSTIYFGAQVLLRSPDRGDSWEVISPDLTRALTYENQMNAFGTLRVIAESPLVDGLLAVGTDDGLVQITEDGGVSWRAAEPMPGVPELALVRRIVLSSHDSRTIYVASSSHEYNDFTPYLMRSTDLGRSWEPIASNLPDGEPVRAFAEHPRSPDLLFVGTERGVWVSVDRGGRWISLRNDMPTVAIHDMVVHPRDDDLVVGTHGRGIWILDHLAALERIAEGAPADGSWVAPVRPTLQFNPYNRGRGTRGSTYFRAENPPTGVMIDYYLAPGQAAPELTIHDGQGRPVRRLRLEGDEAAPGFHRTRWDMRYDPTWTAPPGQGGRGGGFGGFGGGQGTVESPWVLPGEYEVRLADRGVRTAESVRIVADPLVTISDSDRRYLHDLQRSLSHLLATARRATATARTLADVAGRAEERLSGGAGPEVPPDVADRVGRAGAEIDSLVDVLGDLSSTAGQAYAGLRAVTAPPTAQEVRMAELVYEGLEAHLQALERLRATEMPELVRLIPGLESPPLPDRPLVLPPEARLPGGGR